MTDTFSPGPWTVIPHPDKDCGARGIVTQEAVDQATAFNDDAFSSAHTTCYLNAEANARLIAAAPELYEALEAVCAQLVVQMEWNDNHNVAIRESAEYLGDTSLAREALAEAKAALSKASQQQGSTQAGEP